MGTRSAFFSTRVSPGKACKLALPPCSSLELSNVALEAGTGQADPSARCVRPRKPGAIGRCGRVQCSGCFHSRFRAEGTKGGIADG